MFRQSIIVSLLLLSTTAFGNESAKLSDMELMLKAMGQNKKINSKDAVSNQNSSTSEDNSIPFVVYAGVLVSNSFEHGGKLKVWAKDTEGTYNKIVEGMYWSLEYEINQSKRDLFREDIKSFLVEHQGTMLFQGQDYWYFKFYDENKLFWTKVVYRRNHYTIQIVKEKTIEMTKLSTENIVLENLLFDSGKATIKKEAEGEIDILVENLNKLPILIVEIQGHTDSSGNTKKNLILSKKRALTVLKALIDAGIEKNRLTAQGYGDSKPRAENSTAEGRRKNRRVELKILK